MPITSESSKFKGVTQSYVVKLSKSVCARYYCPKSQRVPDTPGTRANSSPDSYLKIGFLKLGLLFHAIVILETLKLSQNQHYLHTYVPTSPI